MLTNYAQYRACLKDIPDNLIFHLKRFDFNLKTLQRSKINDYFAFPTKIDMQPYTIEHLSGANSDEPDIFELVGVLVHSGTAETGHYYSFIRERPNLNDRESWVEFNDDLVTPWDPSMMEASCFGGADFRSHFDAGGAYERVYSAYMLFYQRSTALDKEKELLWASGKLGPLRCELPRRLEVQVKEENWGIVQRHCLHDPSHIPFVHKVLSQVWGSECSQDHRIQNLAVHAALGHLDQVASRAKELPDYDLLKGLLNLVCQRCPQCCVAFFHYLNLRPEALRNLLQKNSEQAIRQDTAHILVFVLKSIKANFPEEYGIPNIKIMDVHRLAGQEETTIMQTAGLFLRLWETFHNSLRAWPEYFGTMTTFAQLGPSEAAALLDYDFLAKAIMILSADPNFDLSLQYAKMLTTISRRMVTRPPNYGSIIDLIDALLNVMDPKFEQALFVEQSSGRFALVSDGTIPFAVHEVNLLHREWGRNQAGVFLEKLIQIDQNPVKTDSIIRRLMGLGSLMNKLVFTTLKIGITGQLVAYMVSPYLRVAVVFCRNSIEPDYVRILIRHVSNQCRVLQNAEGRSFFEFQRDVFEENMGEPADSIEAQSLQNLSGWAPGLLGCIDRTVSYDVEMFLHEKLLKHGPSPAFGESNGGLERSRAMNHAGRKLGIACLEYLRDTYVSHSAQAAREMVLPLEKVIKTCEAYFNTDEDADSELESQYKELRDRMTSTTQPPRPDEGN